MGNESFLLVEPWSRVPKSRGNIWGDNAAKFFETDNNARSKSPYSIRIQENTDQK